MMPGMEFAISKTVLLAIVLAPLAGAILAGLFGRQVGRAGSHWITILGVAASCPLSIYVLWQLVGQGADAFNVNVFPLSQGGCMDEYAALMVVNLTAMMWVVVTFVQLMGRDGSHWFTILCVAASCALSVDVFWQLVGQGAAPFHENVYTFFQVGSIDSHVGFMVDNLPAMMLVVVTFVSLLVHVYTIGYMADDPGYQRFFSYISLFTFSMLMLVMSNNFLQLFFGWEAVGLVSYLLIGFWFKRNRKSTRLNSSH